jgi:HemX protein
MATRAGHHKDGKMTTLFFLFHVLIPLVYLVVWASYMWLFWTDHPTARRFCTRFALLAVVIHGGGMVVKSLILHRMPMGAPLEFASALALALLTTYLVIEKRAQVKNTGFLVTGMAFLLVVVANVFGAPAPEANSLLHDSGFASHTILMLLAYTALSLSFLYAILYLILARQLMRRQFGLLFRRLPSLDILERMSVGAVELGIPLLLFALCLGHLWMVDLRDRVASEMATQLNLFDPKILMAWFILLMYGIGLVGHRFLGWCGRRMNILAVAFYLIVITATGLIHHFFPSSFHNFKSTRSRVEWTLPKDSALKASPLALKAEDRP